LKSKMSKMRRVMLVLLSVVVVVSVGMLAAIPPMVMGDMVNAHMDVEVLPSSDYGVNAETMRLTTDDALSLAAWEVKAENPKGIVILLSGIQNPSVTAFWGYAKMLGDNGYASLLIEMRAHGDSEGDRVCLGMEEYLDVKAGVDYIGNNSDYAGVPIIVWGTSMGASTAINAIGELDGIDGLISCSAFSSWQDVFCDSMVNMGMPSFVAAMEKPFVSLYLGLTYGFDKLDVNPLAEIVKLNGRPALLAHSTGDSQVPYQIFERLKEKVADQANVQLFTREGDEHFICYEADFGNPTGDVAFSSTILKFLDENFN